MQNSNCEPTRKYMGKKSSTTVARTRILWLRSQKHNNKSKNRLMRLCQAKNLLPQKKEQLAEEEEDYRMRELV